jgi:hypothetical protein
VEATRNKIKKCGRSIGGPGPTLRSCRSECALSAPSSLDDDYLDDADYDPSSPPAPPTTRTRTPARTTATRWLLGEVPYDEAVVLRRLAGDHSVAMTKPDRQEIVRCAQAAGLTYLEIEDLTGC